MAYDQLKLNNQLCFPVYAASRLIIREYQPYLDELGITYPQYLVLMVLWEEDGIAVTDIGSKLVLKTNTVTPLLKRLEAIGLIERCRTEKDERQVIIKLTENGKELRKKAAAIPGELALHLLKGPFSVDDLYDLKAKLDNLVDFLARSKG